MGISKMVGGILLIIGTSIGGGMLALPVATASVGFVHSLFFLVLCWLIMTLGALLILEVNLRLPSGSNMVSMAKATLGMPGQIIAWVTYLFLLYALLAAYISGGGDVLNGILSKVHLLFPAWLTPLLFTLLFSFVVYGGIRRVDYVNRVMMFGKLGVFVILLVIISPHASINNLKGGHVQAITGCLMIMIASFGFASIIPSLCDYFNRDGPALRKVIIYGSLIPLLCYTAWDAAIMGTVVREGNKGLISLMNTATPTSELTSRLSYTLENSWITGFFRFFTSICMVTAFLGVSIGLFDFLADGLSLKKQGRHGSILLALTFVPPLSLVLINPGIYLQALNYAGFCCVILLLLMPVIMAYQSRKSCAQPSFITVRGGRFSLLILAAIALGLLFLSIT